MQIFIETLHNRIGERFSGKRYFLQCSAHKVYTKDVEIRKIAYKALCCDRSKVTSQLVSFQSQNLSLV